MIDYRYMLIRYVPDQERMEPVNVGIILQSGARIDMRFSPHAAKRKTIDTSIFNEWKEFFRAEIHGKAAPLFQPERTSGAFLNYLEGLCGETVLLSSSLLLSVDSAASFDKVLESLYSRLVAPPEVASHAAATRPTGRFRQIALERSFEDRGLKKHAHVRVGAERLWMAYRQLLNGDALAFDKVEVANRLGQTSYEIERLPRIAEFLPRFIEHRVNGRPSRYLLIADNLAEPFTDQPQEEFSAMSEDLEEAVERIRKCGGEIIRRASDAEAFAEEVDRKLTHGTFCSD